MKPRRGAAPEVLEQVGPGGCCGWCGGAYVWGLGAWWCRNISCQTRQAAGAVKVGERWVYVPTSKGVDYEDSRAKYRLLGGAAGGAKSHIIRWGMLRKALRIPGYEGLLLRRTLTELEKSQLRRLEREVPLLGGVYTPTRHIAEFPNGSLIEAGHLDDKAAVARWLSTEYDEIDADEGSTFDPGFLLELSTRARSSKPAVKAAGGPWFGVGTNPGGPAWPVLRDLFVTHQPDFEAMPKLREQYDPAQWAYIKALLDDNPYRDEDYETSLAVLGPERYEQLRWGAEHIFEGAFFQELRAEKDGAPYHACEMEVPRGTTWSAGMDWGYNAPGCVGFYAHLADGHYHQGAEYKFRQQNADQVAAAVKKLMKELRITKLLQIAGDPNMWAKSGHGKGESIAETLMRCGLPMRKADNDRFNGAIRMHEMLRDDGTGRPYLTVSAARCPYWWRSIPALVRDPKDFDDVDTALDDHAYDASRYWAMARPSPTRPGPEGPAPVNSLKWWREREKKSAGALA